MPLVLLDAVKSCSHSQELEKASRKRAVFHLWKDMWYVLPHGPSVAPNGALVHDSSNAMHHEHHVGDVRQPFGSIAHLPVTSEYPISWKNEKFSFL